METMIPAMVALVRPGRASGALTSLSAGGAQVQRAAGADQALDALSHGAALLVVDEPSWAELEPRFRRLAAAWGGGGQRPRVLLLTLGETPTVPGADAVCPLDGAAGRALEVARRLLLERQPARPVTGAGAANAPAERPRLLVVDDSRLVNAITESVLGAAGYEVLCLENPLELRRALARFAPELVLVDFHIPALRGDKLVELARTNGVAVPMAYYSSAPEPVLAEAARKGGVLGYVRKGVPPAELVRQVREVLERARPAAPAAPALALWAADPARRTALLAALAPLGAVACEPGQFSEGGLVVADLTGGGELLDRLEQVRRPGAGWALVVAGVAPALLARVGRLQPEVCLGLPATPEAVLGVVRTVLDKRAASAGGPSRAGGAR